jgi:hypothetical protein
MGNPPDNPGGVFPRRARGGGLEQLNQQGEQVDMNTLSLLLQGGMQLSLISVGFAAKIVPVLWAEPREFVAAMIGALPTQPHPADAALTLAVAKAAASGEDWQLREVAQQAIQRVVERRPELAPEALGVAREAVTDPRDEVRDAARRALEAIIKKRPDLADTSMAKAVAKAAASHGQWDTRKAAQQTLGLIIDKNPELAEPVLAVTKTAAVEGQDDIREAAQQTLELIVRKRPELADDSLVQVVVKAAATEEEWYVRKAANLALGTILDKRPDLGKAALDATQALIAQATGNLRAVQQLLGVIQAKHPDLASPKGG